MREKTIMLNFRVSPAELERINQKREEIGIRNMGAYLRKMAMDGYCVNLDMTDIRRVSSLLGCGIYCVVKARWTDVFLLTMIEMGLFAIACSAVLMVELMDSLCEKLSGVLAW